MKCSKYGCCNCAGVAGHRKWVAYMFGGKKDLLDLRFYVGTFMLQAYALVLYTHYNLMLV